MLMSGCPGAAGIKGAPTLKIKTCPECGGEIELFSSEVKTKCTRCGFVAYNDTMSCISWCEYARECIGDKLYEQFLQRKEELEREKEQLEKELNCP